jgi:molybdopterin-guanine dinucleotide biosynthesis protein A
MPGEKNTAPITAFVLAGGKSTRMGTDKTLLQLGGKRLIEHALDKARHAARQVRLVGDPARLAEFGTVVPDRFLDRGPLAGIHAALLASATDFNLMLAVDVPFVSTEFLRYLIVEAQRSGAVVTVARTTRCLQPLSAVYRKSFAEVAHKVLMEGRNRIDRAFEGVPTRIVEPEELRQAGFAEEMFANLNTPEEYEKAREKFRRS